MTHQEQIALIRQACIAANPEIATRVMGYTNEKAGSDFVQDCTIRLADVLLAIESVGHVRGLFGEKKTVKVMQGDTIQKARQRAYSSREGWTDEITLSDPCKRIIIGWNLRKDDLTEQSPECITFLADLLK